MVTVDSDAKIVGDEALLIAKQTGCPMAVGPLRVDAANLLLKQADCNVILSDDGLQHYALNRDIEIAVIDGERRFGNGYCLPAGPLREPIEDCKVSTSSSSMVKSPKTMSFPCGLLVIRC